MISVDVTATTHSFAIDQESVQRLARRALKELGSAQVSIVVIGDQRMRGLNRDALGHDYVTDVLSFDHGDSPEGRVIEVIVCAPHARRVARRQGIPFDQELARYVVHGCLHCAGHDDHTPGGRDAMWQAQEAVLRRHFGSAYRPPG
jgi:probable rRNA maturation factor